MTPIKGYIILGKNVKKITRKAALEAMSFGDFYYTNPKELGLHMGKDERVYKCTIEFKDRKLAPEKASKKEKKMGKKAVKEVAWGVYEETGLFSGNTFPTKKEAVEFINSDYAYGYKIAKVFVTPYVAKKK